jgi:transposase
LLSLPAQTRVFVARAPVDFRKAHDGLCQIVRDVFGDDPLSGHWFVFTNRRRDRVKILVWDDNGFWLFYKRLERGTFACFDFERGKRARLEIDRARLYMLLEGIEFSSARFRARFVRTLRIEEPLSIGRSPASCGSWRCGPGPSAWPASEA